MPEEKICAVEECPKVAIKKTWCNAHYRRWYRHGDPTAGGPARERHSGECRADECGERATNVGNLCQRHYNRMRRTGDPNGLRRAPNGSGYLAADGYRILHLPGHPNASPKGRLAEHRLIMSEVLGRPLAPGETVHHINGVRDDNRPENLELWVTHQPSGQRPEDLLEWADEIIRRYRDPLTKDPA